MTCGADTVALGHNKLATYKYQYHDNHQNLLLCLVCTCIIKHKTEGRVEIEVVLNDILYMPLLFIPCGLKSH